MSDTKWMGLISIALALIACIVPTVTILSARREAREARQEAQAARIVQDQKMASQDEVLATVATKDAVEEVRVEVNSKATLAIERHDAALKEIIELKKEVLSLNASGKGSTPVAETPSKVTITDGVVTVEPNGHAVEVVSEIPPAQPAQPPVAE